MKSLIKLRLAVATVLLSVAPFSSAATALSLNGEWKGSFQCTPSPTDPVKVPAYNASFNLSVSGVEATGSRVASKVTEVLKGVIDADGKLKLSGSGQLKSGEGKPWTTTISGSFAADSFSGGGGMYDISGNQVRDCTVSLGHVGVAQSTGKNAVGGSSQVIPKYLELARELVATVKPDNNQYKDGGPEGVRMKGELFASENTVAAVCTSFVQAVLERTNSPAIAKIKTNSSWKKFVRIQNYHEAAQKNAGLTRIGNIHDVVPGDLFMMSCSDQYCRSVYGPALGHIAIVDVKPYRREQGKPVIDGTEQWVLTVVDVDDMPHSRDDTRYTAAGEKKVTGVGRGSFFVYTDKDGVPVGYTSGFRRVYFDIAKRPILFERPDK